MKKTIILFLLGIFFFPVFSQNYVNNLVLRGSLWTGTKLSELELYFEVNDNVWNRDVLGYAVFYSDMGRYSTINNSFNKMDHFGKITNLIVNGNSIQLTVDMDIQSDPWVKGGKGIYTININQTGDSLIGSYSGTFRDTISVSGTAKGIRKLNDIVKIPNYTPFKDGEHPRVVYRKSEIDSIRYILNNTPEGQAINQRLNSQLNAYGNYDGREGGWKSAGFGLKYSLTGDSRWADSAKKAIIITMTNSALSTTMIRLAPRYMGVAIGYDFCYDYWNTHDRAFRERVTNWLEQKSLDIIAGGGEGYNSHPWSNWMGIAYGSLGTIEMAIMGDSARFIFPEPIAPFKGSINPNNVTAGSGVQITTLLNDSMPKNWLFCGPFTKNNETDDCLASIGGSANVNPSSGTSVTFNDSTRTFSVLKSSLIINTSYIKFKDHIDLVNAVKHKYYTTAYYYTIIENTTPRWTKYDIVPFGPATNKTWLGGKEIKKGDFIYLESGKYSLMVESTISHCDPWGVISMRPVFYFLSTTEINNQYNFSQSEYVKNHDNWNTQYQEYLNGNKKVYTGNRNYKIAQQGMYRWLTMGSGDHGFYTEGEGYIRFALTCGASEFLHGIQVAKGLRFAESTGANWILPKVVMEEINSNMWAWGPAGWSGFGMQEERSGEWNTLFTTTYTKHLPALKYLYDKEYGLAGDKTFNIFNPHQAGYILKSYPFKITAENSKNIDKIQYDKQKGYIILRNKWLDDNDIITTMYFKHQYTTGTHQASDLPEIRLQGLGNKIAKIFINETAVTLNNEQGGKIKETIFDQNGSAILRANMSNVYLAKPVNNIYPDQGVRAFRSVAVDYSNESGSPALYVVVDEIGGTSNEKYKMEINASTVTIVGNTFTANYSNGAKLYGRFILPTTATITYTKPNLTVSGGKQFYIVMTYQNGNPPAFTTTGSGIDTKVIVGNQEVWYKDSILHLKYMNSRPSIQITAPLFNTVFSKGDNTTIIANATDDGTISKVEFYVNNIKVGEDVTSSYTHTLTNLQPGNYVLTAVATDNNGQKNTSNSISITVNDIIYPVAPTSLTASLTSFNHAQLNWIDNSTNESGFKLERKEVGGTFMQIATLGPNITSYLDTKIATGTYTYRIRSYNENENSTYSNECSLILTKDEEIITISENNKLKIYPNPADHFVQIQLPTNQTEIVSICDLSGKILYQNNPAGNKSIEIDISSLSGGIYLIVVKEKEKIITDKLVVK